MIRCYIAAIVVSFVLVVCTMAIIVTIDYSPTRRLVLPKDSWVCTKEVDKHHTTIVGKVFVGRKYKECINYSKTTTSSD